MVAASKMARIPGTGRILHAPPNQQGIALTLLVALGYFVSGRLGQLLAFPPSYATAVWPPSGIALAAVLLIGPRAWLGVFLGAFLVNGWTPWMEFTMTWLSVKELAVATSISLGVTGQALLGGYLIGRCVGFPNLLIHDRQILAFLALGGPVACLLAPTVGVASLALAGKAQGWTLLLLNWWTWWVGDVIGVILFAPLTVICFARPRKLWRPRLTSVALPLTGAIAVTLSGFILMQMLDEHRAHTQFDRIAGNSHQLFDNEIERHLESIDALQRYFAISQFINQAEFFEFNRESSDRCEATKMVAWAPLKPEARNEEVGRDVPRSIAGGQSKAASKSTNDRTAEAPTAQSVPVQVNSNGDAMDAGSPSSLTLAYVYPEETPFFRPGDDFASHLKWHELMQQACDSGHRLASPPFVADDLSSPDQRYVVVLAPVYQRGSAPKTVALRRETLTGFLVAVIDIASLVQHSAPLLDKGTFHLSITDITDASTPAVVYAAGKTPSPHKSTEVVAVLRRDIEVTPKIGFSGRTWACRYVPMIGFYSGQEYQHRWMILVSGLGADGRPGCISLDPEWSNRTYRGLGGSLPGHV